jgi:nucleoside-diphosphate-sugar epimerase
MKIIVTGSTGSLGAYLVRSFSTKGHEVIASGRTGKPPANLLKYASYIQADITDPFSLPSADVCIHTAAIADDKAGKKILHDTNVNGTRNVIQAASSCAIFIHISSSSVYEHSNELRTESMAAQSRLSKLSLYGASKLLAEKVVAQNQNDCRYILRPRSIYGPGDKVLLPRLLKLVRNHRLIKPGNMQVHLSMTHFENLTLAIEKCMLHQKPGMHIYNVADDVNYILYNVIKKLTNIIYETDLPEKTVPLWIFKLMSLLHIGDATPLFINTVSKSLSMDISKIRNDLGYSPILNLDNSISGIHNWIKSIGGIAVLKDGAKDLAWI